MGMEGEEEEEIKTEKSIAQVLDRYENFVTTQLLL